MDHVLALPALSALDEIDKSTILQAVVMYSSSSHVSAMPEIGRHIHTAPYTPFAYYGR